MAAAIIIGLFYRLKEEQLIEAFLFGAKDLLGVAFIIGISRGITVIMNNGAITDTILYWGEGTLAGSGKALFLVDTLKDGDKPRAVFTANGDWISPSWAK